MDSTLHHKAIGGKKKLSLRDSGLGRAAGWLKMDGDE
jgi:hypothetical protein